MLPQTLSFQVRPEISEVPRLNELLSEQWFARGLPEDLEIPMGLVLEELLSNVIRHGKDPAKPLEIEVQFHFLPESFGLEILDTGKAFDPLQLPPPVLSVPLQQRKPGGMGVMLVRKLADELRYEFRDGRNCISFRKNLPAG